MALHAGFFGRGVGIIFLDDVECVGNEPSLLNCTHIGIGVSNCQHREDVSLLCQGEKEGKEWGEESERGKGEREKEGEGFLAPAYSNPRSISCNLGWLSVYE